MSTELTRCAWCTADPLYLAYHDNEWGVPLYDDRALFELLLLEGAQAGLNWLTILKKRQGYRRAFAEYDIETVARYSKEEIHRLRHNPAIIRNRLKIEAAIKNARAALAVLEKYDSLASFFWRYVDYSPRQNSWSCLQDIPPHTPESLLMSRDLKQRGFAFVGPTICYAFMQATGMVNDHTTDCFRYQQILRIAANDSPARPG